VAEEIAFGPENLCVAPAEIGCRIEQSLAAVGLRGFGRRNVERMSAGQKQRLAIASVLAMNPRLLLLDEPTSQLDGPGKAELAAVLKGLKERGYTLLITDHDLAPFVGIVDRCIVMNGGRIEQEFDHIPSALVLHDACAESPSLGSKTHGQPLSIVVAGVCLSFPGIGPVLRDFSLQVARGERIHISGCNGSGKSNLLRCLAGVIKPDAGKITVAGIQLPGPANLLGKVGFLFQNPQRQLFENTVQEEVAFSLKRRRLPEKDIRRLVGEALAVCEADHLAERVPLSLSFGEQHRVALASVLAPQPEVLLLDEPFSGLDLDQRHRLLKILAELRDNYYTTVLIASHDRLPAPCWADRIVCLENSAREA
jgi:energy-coupling factor transport system ATP-binding protein